MFFIDENVGGDIFVGFLYGNILLIEFVGGFYNICFDLLELFL